MSKKMKVISLKKISNIKLSPKIEGGLNFDLGPLFEIFSSETFPSGSYPCETHVIWIFTLFN
jgi:hypothetical protein